MREITIRKNYKKTKEYVYESLNEMQEAGLTYKEVTDKSLKINDYVRSDNGYYVRVLNIHVFKAVGGHAITLDLPCMKLVLFDSDKKGVRTYRAFNYRPGELENTEKRLSRELKGNKLYLSKLLIEGVPFIEAARLVYGNYTANYETFLRELVEDPRFLSYLKEKGYMETFKSKMKDIGLDESYLADKIKTVLDNDAAYHPSLVKHCITIAEKVLSRIEEDEEMEKVKVNKVNMDNIRNKVTGKIA